MTKAKVKPETYQKELETKKRQRKEARETWGGNNKWKCEVCGADFKPFVPTQKRCSPKCRNNNYKLWKVSDPVRYRAFCLSNCLTGLKEKVVKIRALLEDALDKPCRYCQKTVDLKTASLDHIVPLQRATVTKEKERELNQIDNLQIICKKCNSLKSNFSDAEYQRILDFCHEDPLMGDKLLRRLARSNVMWGFRKGR